MRVADTKPWVSSSRLPDWQQATLLYIACVELSHCLRTDGDLGLSPTQAIKVPEYRFGRQPSPKNLSAISTAIGLSVSRLFASPAARAKSDWRNAWLRFCGPDWVAKPSIDDPDDCRAYLRKILAPASMPNVTQLLRTLQSHEIEACEAIGPTASRAKSPFMLSISNSHASTTVSLARAKDSRRWQTAGTGVLSFDTHHDMYGVGLSKGCVMDSILRHNLCDRVAVLGIEQLPIDNPFRSRTDFVLNRDLYHAGNDRLPSQTNFIEHLRQILSVWKFRGITQIYTTVDLDALRLLRVGYTGTDYNPIHEFRAQLASSDTAILDEPSFSVGLKNLDKRWAYGIPAAWVTRAMRIARDEFGFHLGLRPTMPDTPVWVGDVTEYFRMDHRMRTAKIAAGILSGMLATAQGK